MAIADYVPPISQMQQEIETWRNACEHNRTTLRDQLAMAALQGLVSRADFLMFPNDGDGLNDELVSINAYQIADAMLAAREVK